MNWEELRELRDVGMVVGSHGLNHNILIDLKDKLLEMDKVFFKEVFNIDTEKTFAEEEMINTFGMPSTEARREWFAENF